MPRYAGGAYGGNGLCIGLLNHLGGKDLYHEWAFRTFGILPRSLRPS
jgi:hypothetical protein